MVSPRAQRAPSANRPAIRPSFVPRSAFRLALMGLGVSALTVSSSCAHHARLAPDGPAQRFQADASRVTKIEFEDDFVEGRLVLQALPLGSATRGPLRAKLLGYLLGPSVPLTAERLRQEATELGNTDVFDRVYDSLRDAANLFEPTELWDRPEQAVTAPERDLLAKGARLVLALFGPRGAEQQTALALALLGTVDPKNSEWTDRLEKLLSWSDELGASASDTRGRRNPTAVELLQSALTDWPAPHIADRLVRLLSERRQRFASILG